MTVWRVLAKVSGADAASAVLALLEDLADAASAFEITPQEWRVEAYPSSSILNQVLTAQLALVAVTAGGALVEIGEEKLPDRDWLADNQLAFPPLRIGRFFVYGSHYRGQVPSGAIGIMLDAATAFGTGDLAIGAATLLHRRVLASDIDCGAVGVARHNLARNGVTHLVRVRRAPGYRDRAIRKSRYDLILSNILARPLALMARDLARALMPGGRAVLSGLLRRQEPIVLAPHRGCRIMLERRLVIDGWSTLVLRARLE